MSIAPKSRLLRSDGKKPPALNTSTTAKSFSPVKASSFRIALNRPDSDCTMSLPVNLPRK